MFGNLTQNWTSEHHFRLIFLSFSLFIRTPSRPVWLIRSLFFKKKRQNKNFWAQPKFVFLSTDYKYDSSRISNDIRCCPNVFMSKASLWSSQQELAPFHFWGRRDTMERMCHRCILNVGPRGLARHRLSHNNSTRLLRCSIACLSGSSPQKQNTTPPLNWHKKQSIVFTPRPPSQQLNGERCWWYAGRLRWSAPTAPAATRAAALFL